MIFPACSPEIQKASGEERKTADLPRLIIPDIHHEYERAQAILDSVPHSGAIFLGDYWDSWEIDQPEYAYRMAVWLRKRVEEHPEDEFLLGNHDIPYLFGVDKDAGSGFSIGKYCAIRDGIGSLQSFRRHFKLHTWVNGWLLTHAGLRSGMLPVPMRSLRNEMGNTLQQLEAGSSPFLTRDAHGITWCRDFRPIPGIKQIFGHTCRPEPYRYNADNWCIDTALNHYALIDKDGLTVHRTTPRDPKSHGE